MGTERIRVTVSPVTHGKRVLDSWHGLVWLAVFLGLALQAGGGTAPVIGAAVLTLLLYGGFIASLWLLRYRTVPWPHETVVAREDIDEITVRTALEAETWRIGAVFDIHHTDGHLAVLPIDDADEHLAAVLRDGGYPLQV
ncbi:MAG: hypothetical protein ABEK12_00450 [Candidatus Nanohaloarchaea archaeon]